MRTYRGVLKGVVGAILLSGAIAASWAASASASVYSTLVLGDGPVGYWRFGGPPASTAMTDSSPSGNNGTLLNGVTLGVPGALTNDPDTAASFDGVNDSGRVPDANSLDVGSTFTLEGWIKRSTTTKSQELFNKGGSGFQLLVMAATDGNQVWLRKANVTTIARSTVGVPADGRYHHVVAVMNGMAPTIYVDGVQGTFVVTPLQAIQNTAFPITVGSSASAQANFDEFALYPRVLSAAEVLEHSQAGTDIPPTAVDDSATVTEDSGVGPIDVLTNDTDPDAGPKAIASASDPAHGTIVLTGGTPGAHTGLTYEPDANYCNTGGPPAPDTFTYTLTPGGSSATVSVTVTCVDDPPTAVNDSATVLEDAAAADVPVLTNDTDIDNGPKTIASASDPAHGTVVPTGGSPGAYTGLTYQPDANYCNDPPGTTPDTFTYTLNGGSSATVSVTVTCVNDAPTAGTDTFDGASSAVGNTALVVDAPGDGPQPLSGPKKSISGNILSNDTDADGPGPLAVVAGTFASANGGSVVIESDGDFTYTPPVGCAASDSFTYTISDANTPTPGTATGTVNISTAGCVWYVNNNAPGDSGTSTAPFDRLGEAQTASGTGDTIYVYDGDNTVSGYAAGIVLKSDQRLLGESTTLQVGSDVLLAATPANRPTITNNHIENPSSGDVVRLASGNTVRGLDIDPNGTGGIGGGDGTAGGSITGGTIDDVDIIDTGTAGAQPSLELDKTSGTFDISDMTIDNSFATGQTSGSIGVRLRQAGTVNFNPTGTISITTKGAKALEATDTSLGTSEFDDITVTGSGSGAVLMSDTTGTASLGNGAGADLSLQTTGTAGAFHLFRASNVTVPAGGTSNVSASGGPAVDVTGTSVTVANLSFDTVTSANSSTDGVNLASFNSGVFSADSSSAITNAGDIDFDLDGGSSGTVTYDGTITDDVGRLVRVRNTSGTKDFNGRIDDGNDGDGDGIVLTDNTGATIRFDGGLTLSTGANPAFAATGGGTVAVTDPAGATNNTIATTTGTALNVADTRIQDDDLTFEKISSNGAANGIVLNNTSNSIGRLFVTGNGGTCSSAANCSGGAIQGSTGAGISLTSVPGGATLRNMAVTAGLDDGIRATTVHDIDLFDSVVLSNGNSHAVGAEERGLDYVDVTATPRITRTKVSGSDDSNANILNTVAGSTTLTVENSTFSDSKFNAGLRLRGQSSSIMNATVTGSAFSLNADAGFSMQTDSANTAQQTLLFDDNDVSGGSANAVSGRPQVSIDADGASTVKASVTNNDIKSGAGSEIVLNTLANHTGTFDAKVNGNDINDAQPGALDGLADAGTGILGSAHGDGVKRMEIRDNTIRNWGGRAMELSQSDGDGDADYTVTGNTLSTPDVSASTFEGVYVYSGVAGGDASDVCVDMENNDMDGIGRQGAPDIKLDRFAGSLLRFADFNDTSVPNLQTNLRGKNAASPALTVGTSGNGPTATTDTACDLPVGTP